MNATETTPGSPLLIEDRGDIRIVRVNRPEARNALNLATKSALIDAFRAADADDSVRAIVLTGSEKYFVAGTDISEMVTLTPADHLNRRTGDFIEVLDAVTKPVIAAVEGYALGGGCELALATDIVIAGESAKFALPEIKVGLVPGAGGLSRLVKMVGRRRALRMVLTGDQIGAAEALGLGIVSEIVPDGTAVDAALELATRILAFSPLSIAVIKQVSRTAENSPLRDSIAFERRSFQWIFGTADHTEGLTAFLEKRPAQFKGQ